MIDREKDQANLDAALAIIAEERPLASEVHLETSDQGLYGFVFSGITEWSTITGKYERYDASVLPGDLDDRVAVLLRDINWNGVVGENEYGYATIVLNDGAPAGGGEIPGYHRRRALEEMRFKSAKEDQRILRKHNDDEED